MVKFNNPDIVIWNTTEQTAQLIDITFPKYYHVVSTTANKITKYNDPTIETQTCWNLEKATIVPVVIGALWYACDILTTHLADISDDASSRIVQNTALFGTAQILQNFLS